jgi:hypothetical protein
MRTEPFPAAPLSQLRNYEPPRGANIAGADELAIARLKLTFSRHELRGFLTLGLARPADRYGIRRNQSWEGEV